MDRDLNRSCSGTVDQASDWLVARYLGGDFLDA
jgi:hypothetical protein